MTMIDTLRTWARRVWLERDEAAIDEMMLADTRASGLGMQVLVGPEGFKQFHRALCALLSDSELSVDHHIEADGWLAALCTFKATSRHGRKVAITGTIYARIVDGKILEAYNHFDFLGLFTPARPAAARRVGALPRGPSGVPRG